MQFSDLEVGDHFVLPNHIPIRDGVPSINDLESLGVFMKIETTVTGVNATVWQAEIANCYFSDTARVIKLMKGVGMS